MASVTLQCGACGADNVAHAVFCHQCGQPLSSTAAASGSQTRLLQGDVLLNDRYRIVDRAGIGGFGAVYKAADTRFGGRLVAIKEMGQKGLSAQELAEAVEGFKNEALMLAGLYHPHLPRIHDHFSDGGRWYLVMDYIEGETLENYLEKAAVDPATGYKHLSVEETLSIGMPLCTVLDYLHTRQPPIIFRDLKPANVMRSADGHLYLIDFGIARHFKPGQIKDTMPLGSPGYAAPEQYGKGQTTPRADIYSLGVMLHQFISGQDPTLTPFRLAPLHLAGHPALSRLETLILQMVDMDEMRRPATATIIKEELSQIAAQLNNQRVLQAHVEQRSGGIHHAPTDEREGSRTIQSESRQRLVPPSQRERLPRSGPSRRTFIIGGIAGLLALAGAATYSGLHKDNPQGGGLNRSRPAPATPGNTMLYHGHTGPVYSAAWSPDGRSIVSASADQTVQIWDASTGKSQFIYQKQGSESYQALWSRDGTQIISGGTKSVQRWLARNGQHIYTYNSAPAQPGHDLALSPDGTHLAIATYTDVGKSTVQVWNTSNGNLDHTYNTDYIYCLRWAPDNKNLAIGTATGDIRIWNTITGDTPLILTSRGIGMLRDITWSPDGKLLAATGTNGKVFGWDTMSGRQILPLGNLTDRSNIYSLAWSPDSTYIATGHTDGSVSIWLANNGTLIITRQRQDGIITTVAWSPDGKSIASSSLDHTVRVWQVSVL
ncbi:WD40 repeat domain-containing serine/threonine-protein kinase [Dictyobacter formicarum]|uniref:Protein kinase domain-containing protein n=1 Tax=Dictyobacter formicarum TaxID=2778368 RepID=A0ABQ3VTK8_9CHLR|nr:WD40 repeat domain-containing serine/threonine-protein kinase [Dictyobacter formicarum]GHO89212.1 hypothetical protein KSZ_72180 [Dictyobacter formicarum]